MTNPTQKKLTQPLTHFIAVHSHQLHVFDGVKGTKCYTSNFVWVVSIYTTGTRIKLTTPFDQLYFLLYAGFRPQ